MSDELISAALSDVLARVAAVENAMETLQEAQNDQARGNLDAYPVELPYDGVFAVTVPDATNSPLRVRIGSGPVYAGAEAEFMWAYGGADEFLTVEDPGAGTYYRSVVMTITVDLEWGYFTNSNQPGCTIENGWLPSSGSFTEAKCVLAWLTIKNSRISRIMQVQRSGIYVPVRYVSDSDGKNYHTATWSIDVAYTGPTPQPLPPGPPEVNA